MSAVVRKMPDPPMGVVASLASGFEAVNARLGLILLPVALDLFLWLGPHLSIRPLVQSLVSLLRPPTGTDAATVHNLTLVREAMLDYGARYNMFSLLSTAPLGLPSLMAGRLPTALPNGGPLVWTVDNFLQYLLLMGAFVLVGLFLGALYFGGIAQQVRDARLSLRRLFGQVWLDWAQITAFGALVLILLGVIGVPSAFLIGFATLVNPAVGSVLSLLVSMVAVWVLFYLGFTLQGIVLQKRSLFRALWDSLRLVQTSLPNTAGLYTVIMLVNLGLGAVWNLPPDRSWLMLIGLGGHAVVSTALVAATFAFYKDRYRWWLELREALATQRPAGRGEANRSTKV